MELQLYAWSKDTGTVGKADGSDASSGADAGSHGIALQLQRLFAYLQLSSKCALLTKDLTKSFGWEVTNGNAPASS